MYDHNRLLENPVSLFAWSLHFNTSCQQLNEKKNCEIHDFCFQLSQVKERNILLHSGSAYTSNYYDIFAIMRPSSWESTRTRSRIGLNRLWFSSRKRSGIKVHCNIKNMLLLIYILTLCHRWHCHLVSWVRSMLKLLRFPCNNISKWTEMIAQIHMNAWPCLFVLGKNDEHHTFLRIFSSVILKPDFLKAHMNYYNNHFTTNSPWFKIEDLARSKQLFLRVSSSQLKLQRHCNRIDFTLIRCLSCSCVPLWHSSLWYWFQVCWLVRLMVQSHIKGTGIAQHGRTIIFGSTTLCSHFLFTTAYLMLSGWNGVRRRNDLWVYHMRT